MPEHQQYQLKDPFGAWVGVSLLIRAYRLRREGIKNAGSDPPVT